MKQIGRSNPVQVDIYLELEIKLFYSNKDGNYYVFIQMFVFTPGTWRWLFSASLSPPLQDMLLGHVSSSPPHKGSNIIIGISPALSLLQHKVTPSPPHIGSRACCHEAIFSKTLAWVFFCCLFMHRNGIKSLKKRDFSKMLCHFCT